MLIINVYNTKGTPLINDLATFLQTHLQQHQYESIAIVGDFNLHHPLWNPPEYDKQDREAEDLINLMATNGLNLILPPGTITFPRHKTTIDLVWGNSQMEENVLKCQVAHNHNHGSDHYPIITMLSSAPEGIDETPMYDFDKTDWDLLKVKLPELLPPIVDPAPSASPATVDKLAEDLTAALMEAIEITTPRSKICPFSKRWWNDKLTKARKETNKAKNKFRRTENEEYRKKWKDSEKAYKRMIKKSKRNTWRKFVKEADEKTIWKLKKYIDSDTPTSSYIPTINSTAPSNDEKAEIFRATFFPPPPPADLSDIDGTDYPEPVPSPPRITSAQVDAAIEKLAAKKAPGPDEIPNLILKKCYNEIKDHLLRLAQESFETCHFPTIFKESKTLVLRKPTKPDYTKPNAYRPIALECTIGKVLESIMAETISYLTEEYDLLPANHFGGRPCRSTEDAMTVLSENIYDTWGQKKVFSLVLMDVAGAFNNVHHTRLIHNLRKRRIPTNITRWIASFLQNRSTRICFNGIESASYLTPAGVPQGSPLSPSLYLYYNGDLLEFPQSINHLVLGFIDDIAYGVRGFTAEGNTAKLEALLSQAENWRRKHGAQFEKTKYVLIHFTRNRNIDTKAAIRIEGTLIPPSNEGKYLGVIFDQHLKFESQTNQAVKKGTRFGLAIGRIARAKWGAPLQYLRRLFTAVAAARMDYAAIIWHRPEDNQSPAQRQLSKLSTVQRQVMIAILGCFRTTATDALENETGLLPPRLRLREKILKSVTRMLTAPPNHPLHRCILRALHPMTQTLPFRSNLTNIAKHFPECMTPLETIVPYIRPPWWSLKASLHIDIDKESAEAHHLQILPQLDHETAQFYTDGSGINEEIGAAMYCHTDGYVQQRYLGKNSESMVYAGELEAILMAITHAKDLTQRQSLIFTDSQAAMRSLAKPKRQSGQAIIKQILDQIDAIHLAIPIYSMQVDWVPGHVGISGNEKADQAAKGAAIEKINPTPHPTHLKSARANEIHQAIERENQTNWVNGKETAVHLRNITKRNMTKRNPKRTRPSSQIYRNLSKRRHIAWIARLRVGHVQLNGYLKRFNIKNNATCSGCGEAKETVHHYLLVCLKYEEQRDKMRKAVGVGGMKMEKLLGDHRRVKHTVEFIESTDRFEF
jgi:ribonuclease HI